MKKTKYFFMNVEINKHMLCLCSILLFCLFLFYGCIRNQDLIIRGAKSEISEKFIPTNDSSNRVKYISYHKNGTVKEEGYLQHGEREGIWRQFYNDGTLRWVGRYRNGRSVVPEMDSTVLDYTSIVKKGITPDGYYAFRLKLPDSLSYKELMYSVTNANFRLNKEFDSSDFDIKPKDKNVSIILAIYTETGYDDAIFAIKLDSLNLK